ncbi:MAG: hypothetical protein OQK50_01130 [Deltaproteobacteria bacterium]|nr:hypothetical protein [Deltaproteobacteria bacterium]MCW9048916.1 hypothetical protein [Deltaproteobacteria bacterium]
MLEAIDGVRVGVIHGPGGKIKPVWFDMNRKQHRILQVTNSWRERHGSTPLIYFHVTDGGSLYELIYSPTEASWRLEQIEAL